MPAVSGSPTQLAASVTTLANLAGLPDDAYKDGDLAYVQSTRSTYQLDRTSVATPSAVAVDTFSGNGQWVFLRASAAWETQAAWYINPATGDDEDDGSTVGTAIATWAEFCRRVRNIDLGMTVTILSDIAEPLRGEFETASSTSWLLITGEPTVLAFATVTAFVDPVPATNTRGTLTTTDLTVSATGLAGDFASYVGKIVRAPAADGYNHWPILRTSAANVAQGPYWSQDLNTTKPVDNTRIEVLELIAAPTINIVTNGLGVTARYLRFTSTATGDVLVINPLRSLQSFRNGVGLILNSTFTACDFSQSVHGYTSWYLGCIFSQSASGVSIIPCTGTSAIFSGGGSLRPLYVWNAGTAQFQGFMIQGAKLVVGGTTSANSQGASATVGAYTGSKPLGVFDSPTEGVWVTNCGSFGVNVLYGSGNTTYGVRIDNGGAMRVLGTPTITGTTADLIFSGAATAIPPLAANAVVPVASALTTWAQWAAAPFSRNVVSYSSGTRITGT